MISEGKLMMKMTIMTERKETKILMIMISGGKMMMMTIMD